MPPARDERGRPIRWTPRRDQAHPHVPVPEARVPYVQPGRELATTATAAGTVIAVPSPAPLTLPSTADRQLADRVATLEAEVDRLKERVAELELEDA